MRMFLCEIYKIFKNHKEYTLYGHNLHNNVVVGFDIYMKWNSLFLICYIYVLYFIYKAKKIRKTFTRLWGTVMRII